MLLETSLLIEPIAGVELLDLKGKRQQPVQRGKNFSALVHVYPYIKRLNEEYTAGKMVTADTLHNALMPASYFAELSFVKDELLATVFNSYGEFDDFTTAIEIMSYFFNNPRNCNIQLLSATLQSFHYPLTMYYPNNKNVIKQRENPIAFMQDYAKANTFKNSFIGYRLTNLSSIIYASMMEAFLRGLCIGREENKENVFFFRTKPEQ